MSWTNYHGHCNYCDGYGEIETYIKQAIKNKMRIIGISSHAPVPFECSWTIKKEDLSKYAREIGALKEKYKSDIEVLTSLEIDYIPGTAGPEFPILDGINLDYKIGSIHFVDKFANGDHWEMLDGGYELFVKGLDEIFDGDIERLVKRFFQLNREMVQTQAFDIIGHVDKIKSMNQIKTLFDEKSDWYQKEIEETLECIASNGVIMEINTKSFDREGLLFPGTDWFPLMFDKGIGVTINSDAHFPDKLEVGYGYAAEELYKAGYRCLKEFKDGGWIDVGFDKNGIQW